MYVVHIGNIGAQSAFTAHHMKQVRHRIIALKQLDPFDITSRYVRDPTAHITNKVAWVMAIWRLTRTADIVHAKGIVYKRGRHIAMRYAFRRPYVLNYHGSEVRNHLPERRAIYEKGASAILVSTPDLLQYKYAQTPTHVPSMIDEDLFSRRLVPANGRGLCLLKPNQNFTDTIQILRDTGYGDIDWTFVRRHPHPLHPHDLRDGVVHRVRPYVEMPDWMASYEYFADISMDGDIRMDARSATGLQAVSVGCKVIDLYGNLINKVPDAHRPENVCAKLYKVYRNIVES